MACLAGAIEYMTSFVFLFGLSESGKKSSFTDSSSFIIFSLLTASSCFFATTLGGLGVGVLVVDYRLCRSWFR